MSKVKSEVVEFGTKLAESFTIQKNGENATVVHKDGIDPFAENLPAGTTLKHFEEMDGYRALYTAATGYAQGEAAVKAMLKDKEISNVVGTFNMGGKTEVTHHIERSKPVFNPKTSETGTKFGAMTTVVKTALSNQKTGQVGAVRSHIGELALALAKKS